MYNGRDLGRQLSSGISASKAEYCVQSMLDRSSSSGIPPSSAAAGGSGFSAWDSKPPKLPAVAAPIESMLMSSADATGG
ncbi:hypothetical protein NliqN6_0552 [Naganishia liquefaciens]|uniref:Uncharacterized protein n=1 Tax=Naganishia liquefaciens TaxID=104408 RepID=A0A8H3TPG0_9TREE|nr:hypothetical protein NliqN6_0552 [Naganishia liquefaciens]